MNGIRACHMTSAHGAEDVRIFHKECVSLAQAGYEVYLVERGESYDKNGVHIVGVGELPGGRLKRMTEGAKRVYETALALDCDLYHFHDPELLPYGLKLKKKGKKVIFDSHELTREQIKRKPYLPKWLAGLIAAVYTAYENAVLKRLDGVVFPCPVEGVFPLPGKNTAFVNNVPRLSELYDRFDPTAEKERDAICTVGSLTRDRGTVPLIRAAQRAGCRVYLAGKVSPESLEREIEEMPEREAAVFLGVLNREEVVRLLNRCRVGASPLLNVGQYDRIQNLPTKVYEYMAMGLPVILTKNPYNQKMTETYRFGLCVEPEDVDGFAAAIRELLEQPKRAKEMGMNGRSAVKQVFNWEHEQQNLLNLYSSVFRG